MATCIIRRFYVVSIAVSLVRRVSVHEGGWSTGHLRHQDFAIVGPFQRGKALPATRWTGATVPTLVMDGGKSPAWMRNASRALAGIVPNATYRTLDGRTRMVKPKALAPPLIEFFNR
jgi:hypothetical protein